MSAGNDQLRTELARKFQSPIDVLLDPSLLVADHALGRLADSPVFASQTQATLSRTPTEPRLGDLYVPSAFRELVSSGDQSTVQERSETKREVKVDITNFRKRGEIHETPVSDLSDSG